jgi:acetylornithine deacetylase
MTPDTPPDGLSALEQEVVDRIDADAILDDLAAMVALRPVGGAPGEVAVQQWAAGRLGALGLHVDTWEVDLAGEAEDPDYPGMEVARERMLGVVGTWGGTGSPGLVLCGHTDVVPPGDRARWDRDPFELVVEDGVARGRGVCDMLGGVAAILGAVAALAAVAPPLERPLAVHLVSGEEDGGVGAFATLRRGHGGQACLIAEPTGGAVIPANAGSLTFRLEVEGRAAHGSDRTSGESALDHLPVVQQALRSLESARNANPPELFAHLDLVAPISVGTARAGDWASTVPDLLVLEGRHGVLPGESLDLARRALEEAVAELGDRDPWLRDHPVRVTWPGGAFTPGELPHGHPLLEQTLAAATDTGLGRPTVQGAPYGSDLRHYAAQGVPTLQFGPGTLAAAHAANEWVPVDEVVQCARAYAVLALRRCVDLRT